MCVAVNLQVQEQERVVKRQTNEMESLRNDRQNAKLLEEKIHVRGVTLEAIIGHSDTCRSAVWFNLAWPLALIDIESCDGIPCTCCDRRAGAGVDV